MTIVISESMDASGLDLLRSSSASVIYRPDGWEHPNFLAKVLASASAWIVRNQTKVESPFIMPALKVVGRLGVGLDNLDLRTLFAHGVAVVSARGANATAVAEYVIACCLYHRRPLPSYHRDLVATGWHRDRAIGREVFGSTMGLIGMGDISRRVAVKASALGMRVIGFDPYVSPHDVAWMELGVESMDLESLCRQADFVSVHIPKTPQTLGLSAIQKGPAGPRRASGSTPKESQCGHRASFRPGWIPGPGLFLLAAPAIHLRLPSRTFGRQPLG